MTGQASRENSKKKRTGVERTQSGDTAKGLDRLDKSGNRQSDGLDQPGKPDGDRLGDGLDRSERPDGNWLDRKGDDKKQKKSTGTVLDTKTPEVSTPAINTSDASNNEVDQLLELSEKEDEHIKAAGDEEGQNEVRTTRNRFFPEIREKVTGEVTNMKRTHREKDEECSPVKKRAKDLPDWREFKEPERLVIKRKFLGKGDWSETDERTL